MTQYFSVYALHVGLILSPGFHPQHHQVPREPLEILLEHQDRSSFQALSIVVNKLKHVCYIQGLGWFSELSLAPIPLLLTCRNTSSCLTVCCED